jgi:hypothetical protein
MVSPRPHLLLSQRTRRRAGARPRQRGRGRRQAQHGGQLALVGDARQVWEAARQAVLLGHVHERRAARRRQPPAVRHQVPRRRCARAARAAAQRGQRRRQAAAQRQRPAIVGRRSPVLPNSIRLGVHHFFHGCDVYGVPRSCTCASKCKTRSKNTSLRVGEQAFVVPIGVAFHFNFLDFSWCAAAPRLAWQPCHAKQH